MEVSPLSPPLSTAVSAPETPANQISSDFETFLTMLTAQLENQDPLNPVNSTDYATQLATFSGVEQQVKTNDLLTALGQQFGEMGLAQLAGWVGMEARVAGPAYFDGTPITIYPDTDANADASSLVVRNAHGHEVSRQQIPPGNAPLIWSGTDGNSTPFLTGNYSFEVENFTNGELIGQSTAETYGLVSEAKLVSGQTVVVLTGGNEIPVGDITALRAPSGPTP